MVNSYSRIFFFIIIVILFSSSSVSSSPQVDQGILVYSKIKKNSFKKEILRRIKKTLPKNSRRCLFIVSDIKLLRANDEFNVAEEWTIDICQQTKVYFVSTSTWPKGYWVNNVTTRDERFFWEKDLLKKTASWIHDKNYTKDFYYFEEILKDDEFTEIRRRLDK